MTQAPGHPLEDVLAYRFANPGLLARALTHTSRKQKRGDPSYERLEFLGDRVLGLLVAELLMERFPDAPEGKLAPRLAALVSGRTLAGLARALDLASHVKVGPGEDVAGTHERDSVLADCLEAVIGAMYRDGGLDAARGFVAAQWTQLIEDVEPGVAKTDLQEWLQKRGLPLPAYEVVERTGPAHAPEFTIKLTVSGRDPVRASGASKREAEQAAAATMLELIENDA
ncbi:MAG: ribonuclease III [Alphaproteobacteria bacterium]